MIQLLVVDDDIVQLESLAMGLELEGFGVRTAASADAALASIHEHEPELALVDLMMHGTNGLELARILRKRHPRVKVVITSAYHLSERQLVRSDAGVVGFVAKPFELAELSHFLRTRIDGVPAGRLPMILDACSGATARAATRGSSGSA